MEAEHNRGKIPRPSYMKGPNVIQYEEQLPREEN